MRYFIGTSPDHVPADIERFASVDGSVPGAAITFDHHQTGEKINLDAMPEEIDLSGIEAIATTMMDADAIVSAAVATLGGEKQVPEAYRGVLRSACHWCDYLVAHPDYNDETNRAGLGLMASMKQRGLIASKAIAIERYAGDTRQVTGADLIPIFTDFVEELIAAIEGNRALPNDLAYLAVIDSYEEKLRTPRADGSSRILTDHPQIAIIDVQELGYIDPVAQYRTHSRPVQIMLAEGKPGSQGCKYTIGCHPAGPEVDLRPLIRLLEAAEKTAWETAGSEKPQDAWGGRATVLGSPLNTGSRLSLVEVETIVADYLANLPNPPIDTSEENR